MTFTLRVAPFFLVALASAGRASAQITTVGPFTGTQSEGFESPPTGISSCVPGRVFNATADLCRPQGLGIVISVGSNFACPLGPWSGTQLADGFGGYCEYTFDTPAQRFGGRFGNNSGVNDGTAIFFDAAGNQLASLTIDAPATCTWTWNGWDAGSGPQFKSVQIWGPSGLGGGNLLMDAMEVDYGPAVPATYTCTPGDPGINPCPCSNPPTGPERGCNNKGATGGASISAAGSNSLANPTLEFSTADENPSVVSVLLQGTSFDAGLAFGHGVRCASGTLARLYVKISAAGSISAPALGDPSIPARSATLGSPILAGDTRYYQVYYRDTTILLPGCAGTANLYNATNAAKVTWQP